MNCSSCGEADVCFFGGVVDNGHASSTVDGVVMVSEFVLGKWF